MKGNRFESGLYVQHAIDLLIYAAGRVPPLLNSSTIQTLPPVRKSSHFSLFVLLQSADSALKPMIRSPVKFRTTILTFVLTYGHAYALLKPAEQRLLYRSSSVSSYINCCLPCEVDAHPQCNTPHHYDGLPLTEMDILSLDRHRA